MVRRQSPLNEIVERDGPIHDIVRRVHLLELVELDTNTHILQKDSSEYVLIR
jgi:hypothetical protein